MKKRLIYSYLIIAGTFITGCTKNFDALNTNPNAVSAAVFNNPSLFLSSAQIQFCSISHINLIYFGPWVQSLASTAAEHGNGDKYVLSASYQEYKGETWITCYNASSNIDKMHRFINGNPAYSNLDNCGAIARVLFLERCTDSYGDVPYSQEGQATSGIFTPVFDKQAAIYTSMLSQLATATAALDISKDKPKADIFYGGDISKWKKLGYSLMLRVAMRLTKVDPATAQKYAEMAYAGGTMASIDDNANVKMDNATGYQNQNASSLLVTQDFEQVRWSKTLMDFMQSSNDPRISAVAEVASGTGLAANDAKTTGNNTVGLQMGMPNGYDLNGGSTDISKAPGYPGATPANPAVTNDSPAPLGNYSRPRYAVYEDFNSSYMLFTYGESELLLAEAAARGWNTGIAATHYANALTGDMQELAQYNPTAPAAVVDNASITAYVAAHPLVAATALQQINMEYYVETSTTFNFEETWANWRRSGYPVLIPVVYPNQFTGGSIPRRVVYGITLPSTDGANLNAAIARLTGGDNFTSRVWWDIQ